MPDLLGYGEHAASSQSITIAGQVAHLRAHRDAPVHLIGHSVGGVIASLYAQRHPDDVLSLVNVEGNFTHCRGRPLVRDGVPAGARRIGW